MEGKCGYLTKKAEGNIISFKGKVESEIESKKNTEICHNIDNSGWNWYSEQISCIGMNLWTDKDVKILDNKLVQEKSFKIWFRFFCYFSSNTCMTGNFRRILRFCHLWELVKQCSFSVPFTARAAKQKFGVGHVICLELLCQHFPCLNFPCHISPSI